MKRIMHLILLLSIGTALHGQQNQNSFVYNQNQDTIFLTDIRSIPVEYKTLTDTASLPPEEVSDISEGIPILNS